MDDRMQEHRENADRNELLCWACARGLVADATELIHQGAAVRTKDKQGYCPIHFAASHGHAEVIELLLTRGGDVDEEDPKGATPLHHAAASGGAEAVKVLLARGAWKDAFNEDDDSPLHLAARSGSVDTVSALLKAGAKPNLVNKMDLTPMAEAVIAGHPRVLTLLRDNGADPKILCRGFTIAHLATGLGSVACLETILSWGVLDINNASNPEGLTPLHVSAMTNELPCMNLLQKKGANAAAKTVDGLLPADLVCDADHGSGRKVWESLSKAAKAAGATPSAEPPTTNRTKAPAPAWKPVKVSGGDDDSLSGKHNKEEFGRRSDEEKKRKVEAFARMTEAELVESGLDDSQRAAIAEVRKAQTASLVVGAVVALQTDAQFQEDIADEAVRAAMEDMKTGADPERYARDGRIMSVMAKLKKLHAVTRPAATSVKVTLEDVIVKESPERVRVDGQRRLRVMESALRGAIQAAADALSGKEPEAPASTPSAQEVETSDLPKNGDSTGVDSADPYKPEGGKDDPPPLFEKGWFKRWLKELGWNMLRSLVMTLAALGIMWYLGLLPQQQEQAKQLEHIVMKGVQDSMPHDVTPDFFLSPPRKQFEGFDNMVPE